LSSSKKHRVCDRCNFNLDNKEHENLYTTIIRAEEDILNMQEQKRKDLEKKIREAENQEIKQKQINELQESKRRSDLHEIDEKVNNTNSELLYINRSRKLVTKNVKNAEQRIADLNAGKSCTN
jgi:chromosome segregation ATPase